MKPEEYKTKFVPTSSNLTAVTYMVKKKWCLRKQPQVIIKQKDNK